MVVAPRQQPRVAFYEYRFNDEAMSLGGTGIEFASLHNFLEHQPDIALTTIACTRTPLPARGGWLKLKAFVFDQWHDAQRVLGPAEDVLLLVYPKIPFVGHSRRTLVRLLALACYALLALKLRLTRQRLVIMITDLPQEQRLMAEAAADCGEIYGLLRRFCDRHGLGWRDRVERTVEGLLFRTAQDLVSLSPLMSQHILRKHRHMPARICLRGRNAYSPPHGGPLPVIELPEAIGLRVFYSGDLSGPGLRSNLLRIMALFPQYPESHLYVCGRDGEWVQAEAQAGGLDNVHYLGALDYASHDAVARQCHVGLVLYTAAYCHLVLTSKYSAYVANGLAVLSTDLVTLSQVIAKDGVGTAVPAEELPAQLAAWLGAPHLIAAFRERAEVLSAGYWTGDYAQEWFNTVFRPGRDGPPLPISRSGREDLL